MALRIEPDQREYAKEHGLVLFQVMLSTKHAPEAEKEKFKNKLLIGKWQETGCLTLAEATRVWKLFQDIHAKRNLKDWPPFKPIATSKRKG